MAVRLSLASHEVSYLCLGKPALRSLSITDTVYDAINAINKTGHTYIAVWNCHHSLHNKPQILKTIQKCQCIGRVCMVDIICFLCKPHNLSSPTAALCSPLSLLLPNNTTSFIRHLQPNASLLEAIDAMYEGAQNLVIPINEAEYRWRNKEIEPLEFHDDNGVYCWLTQEDVIRYILNSISVFSPTPLTPINTLGVIEKQNLFVLYSDEPASLGLELLSASIVHQSSVAVVDDQGKFIGEISPFRLNSCDEAVAPAMVTLSAGDLLAYIDCGGPPDEELVQMVKERLVEKNLAEAVELLGEEIGSLPSWSSFSSSGSSTSSEEGFGSARKNWKLAGYSSRVVRRSEAIVCYPWSSLIAVMIQALARRVSYVWVVNEDGTLIGIVTYYSMLKIFREQLKSMS